MTTPLLNTLKREVHVAGVSYRVALTPDGLTLARKGSRKAITHTWEELAASPTSAMTVATAPDSSTKATARAVLNELAISVRAAAKAISEADHALTEAGALPDPLLAIAGGDPLAAGARQLDHWFIEPLLTLAEVAAILRVSTRVVRRLPIGTVPIGGEIRYLQSAVREYLRGTAQPAPRVGRWR